MRIWFFHPLIFYPLAALLAVLVITISMRPQSLPRTPAPTAAAQVQGALIYQKDGFNAPENSANQNMTVVRNIWGAPQSLRIAVHPDQPAPAPGEHGVRILMRPADAAVIANRPVTVEVSYLPLPVNAASGLAVSLQGQSTSAWVTQQAPPQPGTLRFELPAQTTVNGIGLRAISTNDDQAYGLEITRIRVLPHT